MKKHRIFTTLMLIAPILLFGQTSNDSELHLTSGSTFYVENGAHFCANYITVDLGATYQTEVLNGTCPGAIFQGDGTIILPVELISFTSEIMENRVELRWATATETNNKGFIVERLAEKEENWKEIGFVDGNGTTSETQNYSFADLSPEIGKLKYRLKQIDYDGSYEYSKEIEAEYTKVFSFKLEQNFPNPFNPATVIKYEIAEESDVSLRVYDVLGNIVAELVNEKKPSGSYTVDFNGVNLSSGFYVYVLRAGNFVQSRKMLLIK